MIVEIHFIHLFQHFQSQATVVFVETKAFVCVWDQTIVHEVNGSAVVVGTHSASNTNQYFKWLNQLMQFLSLSLICSINSSVVIFGHILVSSMCSAIFSLICDIANILSIILSIIVSTSR